MGIFIPLTLLITHIKMKLFGFLVFAACICGIWCLTCNSKDECSNSGISCTGDFELACDNSLCTCDHISKMCTHNNDCHGVTVDGCSSSHGHSSHVFCKNGKCACGFHG